MSRVPPTLTVVIDIDIMDCTDQDWSEAAIGKSPALASYHSRHMLRRTEYTDTHLKNS